MEGRLAALEELREALAAGRFELGLDGSQEAAVGRDELLDQIGDYLIPRLRHLDAPVLVVLGGSTGSGKSTITNTLAGEEVSAAGVLRPSTRTPVLVHRPEDTAWFAGDGVLADLPRSSGNTSHQGGLRLVVDERLPPGLALLDAPDIDSVEIANHELAGQLLGAADVWLFCTTAARYADAVPWQYLRRAQERAVAMAVVVNRIPPGARTEVVEHLRSMLEEHGLHDVDVFAIDEAVELVDGLLDDRAIADVRSWLHTLVADEARRHEVVLASLDGAIGSVPARIRRVTGALDEQSDAADRLRSSARAEYGAALAAIDGELSSGAMLRGEVLDRWREHVGTGELMDRLQTGVGRVRARLAAMVKRTPVVTDAAPEAIESNLQSMVVATADRAAVATVDAWERLPGGSDVLAAAGRGLDRATPDLPGRVEREFASWQNGVFEMVRDQAGNRAALARVLTLGVNGTGVALMIAVFSSTGGLTGTEAGIAAGTAAVGQAVLTAVFGDRAVNDLVGEARRDLELRLAGELEVERARFDRLLSVVPARAEIDRIALAARELGR